MDQRKKHFNILFQQSKSTSGDAKFKLSRTMSQQSSGTSGAKLKWTRDYTMAWSAKAFTGQDIPLEWQ